MPKRHEKLIEFKRLPEKELNNLLIEKKNALMQFKFDLVAGKIKNAREIQETRKDIARIYTILRLKKK